jgi:hypothetical protein
MTANNNLDIFFILAKGITEWTDRTEITGITGESLLIIDVDIHLGEGEVKAMLRATKHIMSAAILNFFIVLRF